MLGILYRAAWAFAGPAAALLARGDGKLARTVRGRRDAAAALARWGASFRDTKRPLVWFHAASVGEGRQAEAVIVPLRAAHPDWQLVYTHASASAERLAATLPVDFAGYLPADTPSAVNRALDAVRPSAIVFSATDLWPELIRQAKRRGVGLALISGTLAPTSSRRGALAGALLRDGYAALDRAGAISAADADALAGLGVPRAALVVTGDTRHDSAAARAARVQPDGDLLRPLRSDVRTIVAGSTWPADEAVLLDALRQVRARPLRVIIAPHEPSDSHLADLERSIRAAHPASAVSRLSVLESSSAQVLEFCLVDRVGILADVYALAAVAFVGGGFHDAGLHSVIEPAALGVPVLFGPRRHGSRDASLLIEAGGAREAGDAAALASVLNEWLDNDTARAASGKAARAVVDHGLGASQRSMLLIEELLG